jgi:hypothetical protein
MEEWTALVVEETWISSRNRDHVQRHRAHIGYQKESGNTGTHNSGVPPHRRRNLINSQEDYEVQSKRIKGINNQQHLELRRRLACIHLIVHSTPFLWHSGNITGHQRMRKKQRPVVNAILPKMGIDRNTSRSVVFGTSKYGGLALDHLTTDQGLGQFQYLIGILRTKYTTGDLYQMLLEYTQQ